MMQQALGLITAPNDQVTLATSEDDEAPEYKGPKTRRRFTRSATVLPSA